MRLFKGRSLPSLGRSCRGMTVLLLLLAMPKPKTAYCWTGFTSLCTNSSPRHNSAISQFPSDIMVVTKARAAPSDSHSRFSQYSITPAEYSRQTYKAIQVAHVVL